LPKTVTAQCTNPKCPRPKRQYQALQKEVNRGRKYCSRSCSCQHRINTGKLVPGKPPPQSGANNHNWKGGRTVCTKGYVMVKAPPGHPRATKSGYIMEHILVAEELLGRYLTPEEEVHHRNGNKKDNRRENLFVFPCGSLHSKYHHQLKLRPQLIPEDFIAEVVAMNTAGQELAAQLAEVAAARAG